MNGNPVRTPAPPPPPIIFRWDLDKTYLQTNFESLSKLVRIPFESAEDKVTLPGVVALIRALKSSARRAGRDARIHFISASPPQIGDTIREKLRLDGVEYDDIVFKDQLQNLMRGKFRNLREQIGYKLSELLSSHRQMPAGAREVLFGDDWESDPIIYSLYADVLSGRLDVSQLKATLEAIRIDPELIQKAVDLCPQETRDVVARIYINLERRVPPRRFQVFGARLIPTFNYLQTAACLFQDGLFSEEDVATVAESLAKEFGFSVERLANSLNDIERRGHLGTDAATQLRFHLASRRLLAALPDRSPDQEPWWKRWSTRLRSLVGGGRNQRSSRSQGTSGATLPAAPIDYQSVIAEWRAHREGAHA